MRLSLASTAYMDLPLGEALSRVKALGLECIDLAVDTSSRMLQLEDLLEPTRRASVQRQLADAGLSISAISNHADGQLLLGPLHEVTDGIYKGTPAEKRAYAIRRMQDCARAADALGVRLVAGFIGCPDYARWFRWPGQEDGWAPQFAQCAEVMGQVLPVYREYGVRFAHELHPKQLVYETESAARSLEVLGEFAEWGFNVDTGNLALAGVDAVDFIRQFGSRIWHVHAKDAEVLRPVTRRHFLAHNRYYAPAERNFRFRIPGWGQLDWRRILTELHLAGYTGDVAVENEDNTLGRWEGCRLALDFIRPLLLHTPRQERWW
ncbi:sugar phosphate isomerase/epimerase family protein [Stigmatella hybrida]|uniref:sugar phosphate isomerase/epimerase family protein n=1 Tax=Stigmatella hybrida TaxID=394097 RepID=UPI001CDAB25B|nr:sugar phosphate isomerase/epimerase [Stigmatella hybrida]